MAQVESGWHLRDIVAGVGLLWSVLILGLGRLVFRVGKVIREHEELRELIVQVRGEVRVESNEVQAALQEARREFVGGLKEVRAELVAELKEMRAISAASGAERDRQREALRLELKEDIGGLHRRLDEIKQ